MDARGAMLINFAITLVFLRYNRADRQGGQLSGLKTRDAKSGCMCRDCPEEGYMICFDTKMCTDYPRQINIMRPMLKLSTTNIRVLRTNDLRRHQQLRAFYLEMNDNFFRIEPGAFNNMSNIKHVTISYNKNLQYLEPGVFEGLTHLECLTMEKNGFHVLKDFTYSITHQVLPSIRRLVIASMTFERIVGDDFLLENTTLREFCLTTCQIKEIHPTPFLQIKQLEVLDLSENKLNEATVVNLLEKMQQNGVNLKELRLRNNALDEMPYAALRTIGRSNITKLNLSRNQFEVIQKFPRMPLIESLDLEQSIVLNITANAFESLPRLKYLYLRGNRFSSIPRAIMLPQVEYLDISSFEDGYLSFSDVDFANMSSLKYLNLSGNNIRRLNSSTFKNLENLEVLVLQQCSIYFVNNSSFQPLKSLIRLNLQDNPSFLQAGVFNGLWRLETLNLARCGLENISQYHSVFSNLTRLKHLNLQGNNIKVLGDNLFAPLADLESLNLSNNYLLAWTETLLKHNRKLRTLNVHNNRIKEFTGAMLDDFAQLEHLELNENPFMCMCPDINVLNDAHSKNVFAKTLHLINNSHAVCGYPQTWSNHNVVDFLRQVDSDATCIFPPMYLFLAVTCPVVLLLIVVIIFYCRHNICYWLFLTKFHLKRPKYNQCADSAAHYEYDAFISYSSEDNIFVVRLVKELETKAPFFKLCVYERDFQIGSMISENILESVAKSRKTLLIVSDAFTKSTWCRWEAQVAENQRIFWENQNGCCAHDSVIIIKLGQISTRHMGYMGHMLKYLMKTRVYLEWDNNPRKEYEFWRKLRNSLTQPNQ